MFAAVDGSKGALKRQQIETWFVTVLGQNTSGLKAGHFKAQKGIFGSYMTSANIFVLIWREGAFRIATV